MALQSDIPLQAGNIVNPLTQLASGIQRGQEMANTKQQMDVRKQAAQQADIDYQFKDMARDSLLIKPLLESGNVDGANALLQQRIAKIQDRGGDPSDTAAVLSKIQSGDLKGAIADVNTVVNAAEQFGLIQGDRGDTSQAKVITKEFVNDDGSKNIWSIDPYTGRKIENLGPSELAPSTEQAALPQAMTRGLTPESAERAQAAFQAAGGGDKGVKAAEKAIESSREIKARENIASIIEQRFPNASVSEKQQLLAEVEGAGSVETGLKAATKLRETQEQKSKAQALTNQALALIKRINDNSELNDVVGPREGADKWWTGAAIRGENETNVINDIDQLANMLTADNLGLMKGVLSDSDLALLRSISAGGLNRTNSFTRFKENLANISEVLGKVSSSTSSPSSNKVIEVDF